MLCVWLLLMLAARWLTKGQFLPLGGVMGHFYTFSWDGCDGCRGPGGEKGGVNVSILAPDRGKRRRPRGGKTSPATPK